MTLDQVDYQDLMFTYWWNKRLSDTDGLAIWQVVPITREPDAVTFVDEDDIHMKLIHGYDRTIKDGEWIASYTSRSLLTDQWTLVEEQDIPLIILAES